MNEILDQKIPIVVIDGSSEDGDIDETFSSSVNSDIDKRSSRSDSLLTEKDSGIDCSYEKINEKLDQHYTSGEEFEENLLTKIVEQIEWYFSDENLVQDAFLLKHIRKNKEGFVSLKLITSFRKVKCLTKDWQYVANAISNHSRKLELNSELTKVRRIQALPAYLDNRSRTVVITCYPHKSVTIELVSQIFSIYGQISAVRIVNNNEEHNLPSIKQMNSRNTINTIGSTFISSNDSNEIIILIEFTESSTVEKVIDIFTSNKDCNWRKTLNVQKLDRLPTTKHSPARSPSKHFMNKINYHSHHNHHHNGEKSFENDAYRCIDKNISNQNIIDNFNDPGDDEYDDDSNNNNRENKDENNRKLIKKRFKKEKFMKNSSNNSNNDQSDSKSSSSENESQRFSGKRFSVQWQKNSQTTMVTSQSDYNWRKYHSTYESRSCGTSPINRPHFRSPLIRLPRGPDGSRGFQDLRQRSRSVPVVC